MSALSLSSLISREVRISSKSAPWLARTSPRNSRSKRLTSVTSMPVEIAAHAGEDGDHLVLHRHRRELVLLEQLGQPRAAIEQPLGRRIEVGAELREGCHLAVLGASSSLIRPATCRIAFTWAAEPTRLTERPTLIAGRMP